MARAQVVTIDKWFARQDAAVERVHRKMKHAQKRPMTPAEEDAALAQCRAQLLAELRRSVDLSKRLDTDPARAASLPRMTSIDQLHIRYSRLQLTLAELADAIRIIEAETNRDSSL